MGKIFNVFYFSTLVFLSYYVNGQENNSNHSVDSYQAAHTRPKRQAPQCRPGYQYYNAKNNGCYMYVGTPKSNAQAEYYCSQHVGILAPIDSQSTEVFIDSIVHGQNQGAIKVWVGLRESNAVSPFWAWFNDMSRPVGYKNWFRIIPGVPSCAGKNAPFPNGLQCGSYQSSGSACMNGNAYWENTYSCDKPLPFICKQYA